MLAVTRLRPARAAWADVIGLFLKGSHDAAITASRSHSGASAACLRARAYIRLERYEKAVAEATPRVDVDDNATRGEFSSIRSLALAYLGAFEEARLAQRDARAYLFSTDAPALEAELHVNEAKLAFYEGNGDQAKRLGLKAIDFIESTGSQEIVAGNLVTSTAIVLADANNLLAALDIASEHRTSAVERLIASLSRVCLSKVADTGMRARLLANLSGCLDGIGLDLERTTIRLVRSAYDSIEWTSELVIDQFHIIRELGLSSALEGDHLSAFRYYKIAFNIAPNSRLRLQALLDRVYLGVELQQHLVAHADLLEAQELASTIDWARAEERDLGSLPTLAMLLAPIDICAARGVLQAYADRKNRSLRTSSRFLDKRFHGDYLLAVAAIARADSRTQDAERAAQAAFDLFNALGVFWCAAQAAFYLRGQSDGRYDLFLHTQAQLRPNSWLAAKVVAS